MARDGLGAHWGSGVSQAKPRTKSVGYCRVLFFWFGQPPVFLVCVCIEKKAAEKK